MKYTADCPECSSEFEIGGVTAAELGLVCPICHHKFKPEKIHRCEGAAAALPRSSYVAPSPCIQVSKSVIAAARLESIASTLSVVARVIFVLGIFATVVSGIAAISDGAFGIGIYVSSGFFSLSLFLFILCQVFHIRATLEKIASK